MKAVFQRSRAYIKTRDASSWFLVTAGFVLIAILAESVKIHHEVGPQGRHHGDVAGGFLLLGFLFSMGPFVLAFAFVGALLSKSTAPFIGALSGWIASVPMLLVLGVFSVFLSYMSPFLSALFPFAVGIALVVTGSLKKAKTIKTCVQAT